MSFAFFVDIPKPTSDFQTPITFLLVDKNTKVWVFIFLDTRKILVIQGCGNSKIFYLSRDK